MNVNRRLLVPCLALVLGALLRLLSPSTDASAQAGREEFDAAADLVPSAAVESNRQLGRWVHLPILNYFGDDDHCETWIYIQNVSSQPAKAVMLSWGEPGLCSPQEAGPMTAECTGLLKPGAAWVMLPDQVPPGSRSGVMFKLSARRLSEHGLDRIFGFDDTYADLMCEALAFAVVGDGSFYRQFRKAYAEGGVFAGIPLDLAAGVDEGGVLAVDLVRECPAVGRPDVAVTSSYSGIDGPIWVRDPAYFGPQLYPIPYAHAGDDGSTTWVYVHNADIECATAELWLTQNGDCSAARVCELATIAPGETIALDASTCVDGEWQGAGWVQGSQGLGVVVDVVGPASQLSYAAQAAGQDFVFDQSCEVDPDWDYTSGGDVHVVFGPLALSDSDGWSTAVHVQNLSPTDAARIKAFVINRDGTIDATLVDWICPQGSQTLQLAALHDLPGDWSGSIRIESLPWGTLAGAVAPPADIAAVATLARHNDAEPSDSPGAVAYALLPEQAALDWPIGRFDGGTDSGAALIAIPSLAKGSFAGAQSTELSISNVVSVPGLTVLAVVVYDQNGPLSVVCEHLNERQSSHIDIDSWGHLANGFRGSAIISAVYWDHDVFDGEGWFVRNLVGIGAASIERTSGPGGDRRPGDTSTGSRGIPVRRTDVERWDRPLIPESLWRPGCAVPARGHGVGPTPP